MGNEALKGEVRPKVHRVDAVVGAKLEALANATRLECRRKYGPEFPTAEQIARGIRAVIVEDAPCICQRLHAEHGITQPCFACSDVVIGIPRSPDKTEVLVGKRAREQPHEFTANLLWALSVDILRRAGLGAHPVFWEPADLPCDPHCSREEEVARLHHLSRALVLPGLEFVAELRKHVVGDVGGELAPHVVDALLAAFPAATPQLIQDRFGDRLFLEFEEATRSQEAVAKIDAIGEVVLRFYDRTTKRRNFAPRVSKYGSAECMRLLEELLEEDVVASEHLVEGRINVACLDIAASDLVDEWRSSLFAPDEVARLLVLGVFLLDGIFAADKEQCAARLALRTLDCIEGRVSKQRFQHERSMFISRHVRGIDAAASDVACFVSADDAPDGLELAVRDLIIDATSAEDPSVAKWMATCFCELVEEAAIAVGAGVHLDEPRRSELAPLAAFITAEERVQEAA